MKSRSKFKKEIDSIKDIYEKMDYVCCMYINRKPIHNISKLFDISDTDVINIVKHYELYEYKVCKKCSILKHLNDFPDWSESYDGKFYYCKQCKCNIEKDRYPKIRESKIEYNKQFYLDNKEQKLLYNKKYYSENKEQILITVKEYTEKNKDKKLNYDRSRYYTNRNEMLEYKKVRAKSPAKYSTYINHLQKYEECRRSPSNLDLIEVKCKHCNKWFVPTISQSNNRKNAIIGIATGDCNFYCSDDCKSLCPIYKTKIYKKDQNKEPIYTTNEYLLWKESVKQLNIQEFGILQCEYCGNQNFDELHVHHINPKKNNPMVALDINNGLVCCGMNSVNQCHIKYGHSDIECQTSTLAKLIC
jgi:hypothetical protein